MFARRRPPITAGANSRRLSAFAARFCRRDPGHVRSLVLLGDMVQQDGRNKLAIKLLGQALASTCGDDAAHDNIAIAYQALGRRDEAIRHYTQAITHGLRAVPNCWSNGAPQSRRP